jgi:hypothetical protein
MFGANHAPRRKSTALAAAKTFWNQILNGLLPAKKVFQEYGGCAPAAVEL